jgi:predicted dehydrogenase
VAECRVAFVGAGAIAQAHAYGLDALRHYYSDVPPVRRVAIASPTTQSRESFAARYGFAVAIAPDELWRRDDVDTIFILGPNETHWPHLRRALGMGSVRRVIVEKPPCADREEERELVRLAESPPAGKVVQFGFNFLQMTSVRHALIFVRKTDLGVPVHFHARYLHGGYLDAGYREKRRSRLQAAPAGGAVADLASHCFSLLVAVLGPRLQVVAARRSGNFPDVPPRSDLCAAVLLGDAGSGAVGTVMASRISAGAGDLLELEIRYTRGALRLSSERPGVLETFLAGKEEGWVFRDCGSDYAPASTYPSPHVPGGWLRSLVHGQYLFFGGNDAHCLIPDLRHAAAVQRLVGETAEQLASLPEA